ncbi:caspase domain-containing protein [Mycena latifolia]|nr:caspase domain-containing protein [Mycena latifolia]
MNSANSSEGYRAIFALIVGIDKYEAAQEFGTLRGAVNDARSFEKFLTDSRELGGLQVHPSCIKFLDNERATRSAILSAFDSHFLSNPNIPDDGTAAMIFFFAGHGSRVESPKNFLPVDGRVEVICPVDERTRGIDGKQVAAIPDYVLAQQLRQLAIAKGNNITVILDSCHSGGMARDAGDARARSPKQSSYLSPPNVRDLIDPSQCYSMWSPSAVSHILLAACSQGGNAYESSSYPFHGHFTESLISALHRAVLKETTYAELIDDLPKFPVKSQIPHRGGAYTDRLLFTKNRPVPGMRTLLLKEVHTFTVDIERDVLVREGMEFDVYDDDTMVCTLVARMVTGDQVVLSSLDGIPIDIPEGSHVVFDEDRDMIVPLTEQSSTQAFLIQAGSFEGVRSGMLFSIRTPQGETLDSLEAKIIGIGQTVLVSPDGHSVDIPRGSRAVVENWEEKVGVYVPAYFTVDLFPEGPKQALRHEQVTSYEAADIALTMERDDILVERITGTKIGYPSETRFTLKDPLQLPSAISGIAHFHHFLERRNKRTLLSGFSLEMHRLQGEHPTRRPVGANIIKPYSQSVYTAEILSDTRAKYGFTICNATNQDLFPYLFYFNPLNYFIKPWYAPERASEGPPLHKISSGNPGKLTLGMGGERALTFILPPGESSSSAFIKLFVSTECLDLGWIEQQISPFSEMFAGMGRPRAIRDTFRSPDWDALQVVLTMTEAK